MKLAVLYSGGKDSNFALYLAQKEYKISCLITILPQKNNSYMFQKQANNFVKFQAEALEIPIIFKKSLAKKEDELFDLENILVQAKKKYKIEGVVTGAIKSIYQASRVQKICDKLNLECFNPLWQICEKKFLKSILEKKFEVLIVQISAYPLTEKFLGKKLNKKIIDELFELENKYKISPTGEGGEIETFVLNSPCFKKKLKVETGKINMEGENLGFFEIKKISFEKK